MDISDRVSGLVCILGDYTVAFWEMKGKIPAMIIKMNLKYGCQLNMDGQGVEGENKLKCILYSVSIYRLYCFV